MLISECYIQLCFTCLILDSLSDCRSKLDKTFFDIIVMMTVACMTFYHQNVP